MTSVLCDAQGMTRPTAPGPERGDTMLKKLILLGVTLAALSAPAMAKEMKSVGITVGPFSNPYFVQLAKAAEAKAKDLTDGKADVKVLSANYDLNLQIMQIDGFIAAGVDLVLLTAADSVAIEPSVKRLHDAGIVAVAVDVTAQGADATVTTDNVQAGRQACQFIADRLKGKGDVIIEDGPPVSSIFDRIKGCKEVFAKSPEINILADSQKGEALGEHAFDIIVSLLNTFTKLDAVFTINDLEAINTDLAAKQQGRKEFFIASVDGSPAIEAALKRPDSLVAASSAQDPTVIAHKAVEIGYGLLQGTKPPQDVVLIPPQLVTRDNVGQYKGWTSK
jgi:ribose transport system substrate-binding protein